MRLVIALVVALAISCTSVRAQESAAKSKVPPELTKNLAFYVGNWSVEGKLGDAPMKGKASFRMPAGDHCIVGTVSFEANGEMYHFSLVSGWDSSTGWFTEQGAASDGGLYALRWRKVSPTVEEGDLVGTLDGKPMTEKDRLERKGEDDYMVTCTERKAGDEKLPDQTFVFHRMPREKGKRTGEKCAGVMSVCLSRRWVMRRK